MDEFFIAIKWPCVCLLWSVFFIRVVGAFINHKHVTSQKTDELHKQIAFWKEKALNFRKPNTHV